MVSSAVYPGLERKPGGPDNWVEKAGGLPKYIERIAKHLHYEKGMTISHAIATAVNTVKRWARMGKVAKYGSKEHVSAKTVALAQKALAEWEAKKAAGKISLSTLVITGDIRLVDLAARANTIEDPAARDAARAAVVDLAFTKDGRKSFRNQGKWKHGFIPVDQKAKVAKAKGSPVAMKRMNRLFGGGQGGVKKQGGGSEAVKNVGQALRPAVAAAPAKVRARPPHRAGVPPVQPRSRQNWDKIPETDKTVRNGKKYVVMEFDGKRTLTPWLGENPQDQQTDSPLRRFASVTDTTLATFSSGQLQKLLDVPGQPPEVRKKIYAMIAKKQEEAKHA